ncbi:toxin-antitoxin system YwqK family antitoxin [Fusobacterium sp. PH5-44]|uniref:toxin-antitoxin system YwqK family antitoxin n=1 Tax=unclassified Fusobacterium TaxID=2648384 RepID=UPI003D20938D
MEIGVVIVTLLVVLCTLILIIIPTPEYEVDQLLCEKQDIMSRNYKHFEQEEELLWSFDINYDIILKKTFSTNKIKIFEFGTEIELYYIAEKNNKKKLTFTKNTELLKIKTLKIPKLKISYDENGVLDGPFTAYYFSGEIMMTGEFKYGLLNGEIKKYSKERYLLELQSYKNGIEFGEYLAYYANGNLNINTFYKDNIAHGQYKSYYKNRNGQLIFKYENGELHGEFIGYYSNGNILAICNFEMGKIHGEYKEYERNGKVLKHFLFESGKVVKGELLAENAIYHSSDVFRWLGNQIIFDNEKENFYDTDNFKRRSLFDNNQKLRDFIEMEKNKKYKINSDKKLLNENQNIKDEIITEKQYYANGSIQKKWNIMDNLICGEYLIYYNNGQIKESISYLKGKKNGKITCFYPNGQLKKIYYAVNNVYEGKWKFFYSNGKIMGEGIFINNYLSDKIKKYSSNGNLKEEKSLINKIILDKSKLKEFKDKKKYSIEYIERFFQNEFRNEEEYLYHISTKEINEIYEIEQRNHYIFSNLNGDGLFEKYYPNGNLKCSLSYFDRVLHGKFYLCFPNGEYYVSEKYVEGKVLSCSKKNYDMKSRKNNIDFSLFSVKENDNFLIEELIDLNLTLISQCKNGKLNEDFVIVTASSSFVTEGYFYYEKLNGKMIIRNWDEIIVEELFFDKGKILGRLKRYLIEEEYIYKYEEPSEYEKKLIWNKTQLYAYLKMIFKIR